MRAGIVAANNIRYSPYIHFYTRIFKKLDAAYELIIPDRNGLKESFDAPLHILPWKAGLPTVVNYFLYAGAVKKILARENYDLIVVLTGNNTAFLGPWLKRHYRQKYIIDIRDYSHENLPPYYLLEKAAIDHSLLNVISSAKFTGFLPPSEYTVCHNCTEGMQQVSSFIRGREPIRIGYVGGLSYVEQCTRLMKLVAGDQRFLFEFYGTSDLEEAMRASAEAFHCERIIFHGGYLPEEKGAILQKVDILFNAYGNGCALLDCALSNKLYDAYAYTKPILTSPGTYMSEMAGLLAFELDFDKPDIMDQLYSWYMQTDPEELTVFAEQKLRDVMRENEGTRKKIEEAVSAVIQVKK